MANTDISEIKKILIHQANAKMDDAIVKRLYKLFNVDSPEKIMPLTVDRFGNSSVATVPTMYDLIVRNKLEKSSKLKKAIKSFLLVLVQECMSMQWSMNTNKCIRN